MTYTAPLADMRFALREVAGLSGVAALPGYEHATDDTIDAVLEEAARRYADNPEATGCLVVEGARSDDPEARAAACVFQRDAEAVIRAYIAARHPDKADEVTDFVGATMAGMSAKARSGVSFERLMAIARLAERALEQSLQD